MTTTPADGPDEPGSQRPGALAASAGPKAVGVFFAELVRRALHFLLCVHDHPDMKLIGRLLALEPPLYLHYAQFGVPDRPTGEHINWVPDVADGAQE
ncbi:hypothetical protein [Streptomyces anulatus]|uniref:hypothetical protein n=1 Tax=Streptomyces anulatus TaxID=1892 RepID=UPI002F9174D9